MRRPRYGTNMALSIVGSRTVGAACLRAVRRAFFSLHVLDTLAHARLH